MSATDEEGDEDQTDDEPGGWDSRTYRPTIGGRPDLEMNAIGWAIFVILAVLLIPLLPAIVLLIVISKLLGFGGRKRLSWGELTG